MIIGVGLKFEGRGLQAFLFADGPMAGFCDNIASLNGSNRKAVKLSKMKMLKKWSNEEDEYYVCEPGSSLIPSHITLTVKGKHNLLMHIDIDEEDMPHGLENMCRNQASDVLTKLLEFSRSLQSQVETAKKCSDGQKKTHEANKEQFRQQTKIMCEKNGYEEKPAMMRIRSHWCTRALTL